jgi:hypothetical protein
MQKDNNFVVLPRKSKLTKELDNQLSIDIEANRTFWLC